VIDTHAHLDGCEAAPEELLTRAREAGVECVIAGTVILHCFSSPGLLETALQHGYYVSFAGNVTFVKADELREAAARVPADRILAETDSPYLAPVPRRGRPNEPANVLHTVAALAEVRGEEAAELAARIDANATAAFALPAAQPPVRESGPGEGVRGDREVPPTAAAR
jgi:Tat protein secretion system quality control protein TatD with DNase activity